MAVAAQSERRVGAALERLCRWTALAGGATLVGMALVTAASIAGRALAGFGLAPVRGDFELVEAGCAIAVFAFLPWCQIARGHVTVDIVGRLLPPRGFAACGLLGNLALTLCAAVILWRLWLGFGERFPLGPPGLRGALGLGPAPFFAETTYELQLPLWLPYGICAGAAAIFALTAAYTVWRSLNWMLEGAEPAMQTVGE